MTRRSILERGSQLACLIASSLSLIVSSAGCTAIVNDGMIRCSSDEGCPDGLTCIGGGLCVEPQPPPDCEPADEICNGIDDDCDELVDEGQDVDGDGFSWCGGGVLERRDCNDEAPEANPEAVEVCDGIDNDCDGSIDEGELLCDMGRACIEGQCSAPNCANGGITCGARQSCDVSLDPPSCVDGSCTANSCPSGELCDEQTGSCVTQVGLGQACSVDGQCEEGVCMQGEAIGLTGDRCSKACCEDADCPDPMICWASGNGARACVLASEIVGVTGDGDGEASCNSGDQCRSGICDDGTCIETCANHQSCGGGSRCRLALAESPVDAGATMPTLSCVDDDDRQSAGESCEDGEDCESGMCVEVIAGLLYACSAGCGQRSDCPDLARCGHLGITLDDDSIGVVQACLPDVRLTSSDGGAQCERDNDCREVACIDDTCANFCCDDNDCTGGTLCRPTLRSGRWEMRCLGG